MRTHFNETRIEFNIRWPSFLGMEHKKSASQATQHITTLAHTKQSIINIHQLIALSAAVQVHFYSHAIRHSTQPYLRKANSLHHLFRQSATTIEHTLHTQY